MAASYSSLDPRGLLWGTSDVRLLAAQGIGFWGLCHPMPLPRRPAFPQNLPGFHFEVLLVVGASLPPA